MSKADSFKKLTRHSFRDFHRDGVLDILVGISLLGFALWLELDIALFAFACWLSVSFYKPIKRTLTIPRTGYVSFEEDQKQFWLGMGTAIIVTILLITARFLVIQRADSIPALGAFLMKFHPYIMSSLGAFLLIGFGIWRGLNRFLIYGIVFLCLLLAFYLLEFQGQLVLFIASASMIGIGMVMLTLFIRKYPVLANEGGKGE
jgi:hypothetical protein